MKRRSIHCILALGAAALAIAGCGGGGDESTSSTTAASGPDLDRYCELITALDQKSQDIYNELGSQGVPSQKDLVDAARRVFSENADLIDELSQVVPTEIKEDFQTSIDSARERAEAGDASQPSREIAQANLRLQKFVADNCQTPLSTDSAGDAG